MPTIQATRPIKLVPRIKYISVSKTNSTDDKFREITNETAKIVAKQLLANKPAVRRQSRKDLHALAVVTAALVGNLDQVVHDLTGTARIKAIVLWHNRINEYVGDEELKQSTHKALDVLYTTAVQANKSLDKLASKTIANKDRAISYVKKLASALYGKSMAFLRQCRKMSGVTGLSGISTSSLYVYARDIYATSKFVIQDIKAGQFRLPLVAVDELTENQREITDELMSLATEFPNVGYEYHEEQDGKITVDHIWVVTAPVTINKVDFGRFKLYLQVAALGTGDGDSARSLKAVALEANHAAGSRLSNPSNPTVIEDEHNTFDNMTAGREGFTHPHVNSGSICFGSGTAAAGMSIKGGRIYDSMMIARSVLSTYSARNPYRPINEWKKTGCIECGDFESNKDCVVCKGAVCKLCNFSCHTCKAVLCQQMPCSFACLCGKRICRQDTCCHRCTKCSRLCCKSCMGAETRCNRCTPKTSTASNS